jgi:hypothetical protein
MVGDETTQLADYAEFLLSDMMFSSTIEVVINTKAEWYSGAHKS